MKADKKASEKEAKVKEQLDQKKPNDKPEQNDYGADEETLDPNVSDGASSPKHVTLPFSTIWRIASLESYGFFSAQQYFKIRTQAIQALKGTSEDPYPHKYQVDLSLSEFLEKYNHLEPGDQLNDVLSVAGMDKQMAAVCITVLLISDVSCLSECLVYFQVVFMLREHQVPSCCSMTYEGKVWNCKSWQITGVI